MEQGLFFIKTDHESTSIYSSNGYTPTCRSKRFQSYRVYTIRFCIKRVNNKIADALSKISMAAEIYNSTYSVLCNLLG